MNESILTSIKKMLGIAEEYEIFDPDLIMHINSVFSVLMCYKKQIEEYEWRLNVAAENTEPIDEREQYTGSYEVTPKAHTSQTLETANKIMTDDVTISEVPFHNVSNSSGGLTSYIAKEADSK